MRNKNKFKTQKARKQIEKFDNFHLTKHKLPWKNVTCFKHIFVKGISLLYRQFPTRAPAAYSIFDVFSKKYLSAI